MPLIPLLAIVRKDLRLFLSDRRSVIVSFVVPIAIASFFGSIFSGTVNDNEPVRIEIALVDHDQSPISRDIVAGAQADGNLRVNTLPEADARTAVTRGDLRVAVIIPAGFGDAAGRAFFGNGEKPALDLAYDPSRSMELALVRGVLTQHVMEAVSRQMFGGQQGRELVATALPEVESSTTIEGEQKKRLIALLGSVQALYNQQPSTGTAAADAPRGITMPYTVREQAMSGANVAYNGYAHAFGGMAIQFLLFAMANLGVDMLLERRRGLWQRFRSAPVSKQTLLMGKAASGALISLAILVVSFAFAMLVFRVRIQGSVIGFVMILLASALMASTFGLLVAALGNSPATARGVTTLAVLLMVMLGGAWVPTFVFPAWMQQVTRVIPVRWAVDGFDAMTWRGLGVGAALAPTLVLCSFAAAFAAVAAARFSWEEG